MKLLNVGASTATRNLLYFLVENFKRLKETRDVSALKVEEFIPLNLQGIYYYGRKKIFYALIEEHIVGFSIGTLKNTLFFSRHPHIGPEVCFYIGENYRRLRLLIQSNIDIYRLFEVFDEVFAEWEGLVEKCPTITKEQIDSLKQQDQGTHVSNPPYVQRPISSINSLLSSQEANRPILESFTNTRWFSYERLDQKRIALKIIEFGTFSETSCEVMINFFYKGVPQTWKGSAIYNNFDNTLIITVLNITSHQKGYIHYLIDVNEIKKVDQICIGHVTYKNPRNLNIVSKTTILCKASDEIKIIPTAYELHDPTIPAEISEFFEVRLLNRLSSPHKKTVTDLKSLRDWIDKKKYDPKHIHNGILGNYKVYFKREPSETEIQTGSLSIDKNGPYDTELRYQIGNDEEVSLFGRGYVDFISHSFCALLNTENNEYELKIGSPQKSADTFLIIAIPPQSIKRVEVLIGIATGVRDQYRGTVSRLMIFIKYDGKNLPSDFDENILKSFFDEFSNRIWIRPPVSDKYTIVYKLADLKDAQNPKGK